MTETATAPPDAPAEESLIPPELAAAVGREMAPSRARVEAEHVRRMADVFDVDDAALEAALASNDRGYDLPPWAIYSITRPQRIETPGIDPWTTLIAAEELHIVTPLRLDDRVRIVQRIAGVQERIGGRVGHSLFIHIDWSYRRLEGRPGNEQVGPEVARVRHTMAHFRGRHTGE
jgi:hypothetical protein